MEESFFESPLIPRKDATLREQKDLLAKEAETHEQEMSGMLQSLNKKEEQLRELNESADHLEAVIRELRAELQRSGRGERR